MPGFVLYAMVFYTVLFGLEYYFAKQKQFWLGLVLPGITFIMAMMNVIGFANTGYGTIITNFFQSNIITFMLLILYGYIRYRMKNDSDKKRR